MSLPPETLQRLTRNEADMAFKRRVATIFEWLPPADTPTLLDCACGRGFYLRYYREVSAEVRLVGLELDADIIRKAQANVGALNVALLRGNIYHLPFEDASFDGVILSEILEHVEDDVRGLREVYRVLKPNGVTAITVPNANYPFWWDPINKTLETLFNTKMRRGPLAGIWANHVRLYTLPDLRAAVQAAGFQIEAERAFTAVERAAGADREAIPFIVGEMDRGAGRDLVDRQKGEVVIAVRIEPDERDRSRPERHGFLLKRSMMKPRPRPVPAAHLNSAPRRKVLLTTR